MQKQTKSNIILYCKICTIVIIITILLSLPTPSFAQSPSTQTTIAACAICNVVGSNITSPTIIANFTQQLTIPLGHTFTIIASGFGSANYGIINNSGNLIINNPLVNYGTILNFGSITISSTLVNMNTTRANALSGLITNRGTITNNGFLYNDNTFINLGTVINNGVIKNCISGLLFLGTVSGTITGNSVTNNC